MTEQTRQMRIELVLLRARYDCGAVSDAVFLVIKNLETDISWTEHKFQQTRRVAT